MGNAMQSATTRLLFYYYTITYTDQIFIYERLILLLLLGIGVR